MALYLIGDLQGCHAPLQRLLQKVDFSPSRDTLYLLGDLVNRGPESLAVLRSLSSLGDAAQCLLGNHDLHLLSLWQGVRRAGKRDTAQEVLAAPDAPALIDWLRHRRLALHRQGWLMVHAGVLPTWSTQATLSHAAEVEAVLQSRNQTDLRDFFQAMYGNLPTSWNDALTGTDRLRVIVNALTRLRFCTPEGSMEFESSGGADQAPAGYLPWFDVPGRATYHTPIAFGHWSTLLKGSAESTRLRSNTLALDTGCVWGGCLSAAKLGSAAPAFELIQEKCEALLPSLSD